MSEVVLSLFHGEITKPDSITMKAIAERVASRHGLTLEDLKGQCRQARIAQPRQEAMWLMRQVRKPDEDAPRYSMPQIGEFLGKRDHTTVLHGLRAHEARLAALQVAA